MSNPLSRRSLLSLALILAAVSLTGCGQEVVDFNNKLAKMEDKLEGPMTVLMEHFQHMDDVKKLDVAKMETDYTTVLTGLDGVIAEVKAVPVIDAEGAKDFHSAYLTYYADIRSVMTGEIRDSLDLMKDEKLSDSERGIKWATLQAAIGTKLTAATNALQGVQKNFASKHNMRLK